MIRRTIPAFLIAAGVLALASPALAAEGGLVIFSDVIENAMNGDGTLWKTPWKGREVQLMILFILLIWPANKFLFGPILSVLDERGERIEGARNRAGTIGSEADDVLGRYEAAVEGARKVAESERRTRVDSARRELGDLTGAARGAAEQKVAESRTQLEATLEQARTELRGQAEALARDAASQVLGRSLS